jgi:hypothetical protein
MIVVRRLFPIIHVRETERKEFLMLNCWILEKTSAQAELFSVTLLNRNGLVWSRILDKTPAQAELFSVTLLNRSGLVRSRILDKPQLKLSFFPSNCTVQERAGEELDIGQNLRSS